MKFITSKSLLSILLITVFCFGCNKSKEQKAGFLLTQKVFSDFKGTKELQKKFKALQDKQKYILDSLSLEIKTKEASLKTPSKDLSYLKETYNRFLSEFNQSNAEQDQQYADGLWKQINQYVNEYGKEHGYAFIYGADGNGNLMYADSTYNVTNEVLDYMNKKYAGK